MMDFMLNAGGTTCNYDTNLYRNVQPKLRANKRDIERPDSCFRRPAAETPADLGQVTGDRLSLTAFAKPTQTQGQETRRRKT